MGSSRRKGCRSALFGDREGCRSDGAEGCRSMGSSRRKGVDLRSGDREGCRSAAWSELELFDPRLRRVRKCSIRRFARAGRVSIRAPGAREGCRSMARIRPEGCRSARPATPKGLDPRDRADRKGVDPRARRPRGVSIHGVDRAGRVSIRASGDSEGSRSAGSNRPDLFDPSPRRPGKCSIRAGVEQGASVRSAGSRGPEGCRSARPAPAKGVDPCSGDCEGCRFAARSGPEGCRSARLATTRGLDPRSCVARKCSVIAPGDGQACRPRGATVSPGRAAWRCRAARER